MLSHAFEWCRAAHLSPPDELVEKRRAAASEIITAFEKTRDPSVAIGLLQMALAGADRSRVLSASAAQLVADSIRKHQAAFPQDLGECAVDLAAVSGIVVGELLKRGTDQEADEHVILLATTTVAGLAFRPPTAEASWRPLLASLLKGARELIDAEAERQRTRDNLSPVELGELEIPGADPGQLATAVEKLRDLLSECLGELNSRLDRLQNAAVADREEVDVLWWMLAAYTETLDKRIEELKPSAAALCVAELADKLMLPPGLNVIRVVQKALREGRNSKALSALELRSLASAWDDVVARLLEPPSTAVEFVRKQPGMLPLSWVCQKLIDGATGESWHQEFSKLSGCSLEWKLSPDEWGIQAFNERISQRAYVACLPG
jgi:hypothetical protein